jgi:hypothetical protein
MFTDWFFIVLTSKDIKASVNKTEPLLRGPAGLLSGKWTKIPLRGQLNLSNVCPFPDKF